MSSRSMKEKVMAPYRKAVQVTSDAMTFVGDAVKQDRAQTAAYKASQAAKAAQKAAPKAAPTRTPNYEPVAVQGVRKLRNKSAEAIRDIESETR